MTQLRESREGWAARKGKRSLPLGHSNSTLSQIVAMCLVVVTKARRSTSASGGTRHNCSLSSQTGKHKPLATAKARESARGSRQNAAAVVPNLEVNKSAQSTAHTLLGA